MMGLFMTAMAVVMLLSGAGIDRINERKAKNQQAQPAQITYVSESAGTSNEPEQATKQNNEPVLAAEGKNDVTAPAAGINNELAQAEEKNEPDVHESMPVYAPVVDEPTPEAMPEVDVAEHNDDSAHVTEKKSSSAAPETEQDKLSEATELWRQYLQHDIIRWLDNFDHTDTACDMLELLYGPGSAKNFCGSRSVAYLWVIHYSYTVGNGLRWEEVRPEVRKLIEDEVVSIAPVLAEKIGPPSSLPGSALRGPSEQAGRIVVDTLTSRIRDRGWDVTSIIQPSSCLYHIFNTAQIDYMRIRDMITHDASAKLRALSHCDVHAAEFCKANKDFPGCDKFLGICKKILRDVASIN